MLELTELRQTRVFQDGLQQGLQQGLQEGEQRAKLEVVPRLLALGLNVEQIAEALVLDVEQVRQVASEQSSD